MAVFYHNENMAKAGFNIFDASRDPWFSTLFGWYVLATLLVSAITVATYILDAAPTPLLTTIFSSFGTCIILV